MIRHDELAARYAGRAAFIDKLLRIFESTHATVSAELRNAAEAGDTATVARLAHSLKSSAGDIMDHELTALAKEAEQAARDNRADCMALAVNLADALEQTLVLIAAARPGL